MQTLALADARIIDCSDREPFECGAVIVEGNRIREVVGGSLGELPEAATVIECRGLRRKLC